MKYYTFVKEQKTSHGIILKKFRVFCRSAKAAMAYSTKTGFKLLMMMLMFTASLSAQTSSTTTSQSYSVKYLSQVKIELNDVEVKELKEGSSRVIVERKIYVTHNTKSDAILTFVKNSGAYNEDSLVDGVSDTLTLSEKENKKAFICNGTDADIRVEYTLYVPKHIKLMQ